VEELSEYKKKKKVEKKYFRLFDDVKKLMNESVKMVVQQNYHMIKANTHEEDGMEELEIELGVLKQVQESQGEIIRGKHNE
jgi:hypothetical protein